MSQHVFRFAPSPNGYLHLGHAYSAILNHDVAKALGGRFLLRIEDIDTLRCKKEYEEAIYEDLHWLGLTWEQPVRRQSEHFDVYSSALEHLKRLGLIYPAFLTRKEIAIAIAAFGSSWPLDPDGTPHYPGTERDMAIVLAQARIQSGEDHAWRLDMAKARSQMTGTIQWIEGNDEGADMIKAEPSAWGDVVVARKDTPTSYNLSVVIDDALQGVTDVIRGRDLYHATSVQCLLQRLLKLPTPRYRHHQLITDTTGRKLSKSLNAISLRQMRKEGLSPADIRRELGL
jgi:glutamyl-Q tRNA(Asp) synthetase